MHQRMMQPGFFFKDTDPVMQGKAGFHNILFLVMVFVFLLQVFKKREPVFRCSEPGIAVHVSEDAFTTKQHMQFYDRSPRRNPGSEL